MPHELRTQLGSVTSIKYDRGLISEKEDHFFISCRSYVYGNYSGAFFRKCSCQCQYNTWGSIGNRECYKRDK